MNHKNATTVDFEKRIHKEISELREKHAFEVETTKNNLVEIYEKQIRFLRDAKEEVDIKCDSVGSQLREKYSVEPHISIIKIYSKNKNKHFVDYQDCRVLLISFQPALSFLKWQKLKKKKSHKNFSREKKNFAIFACTKTF